MPADALSAAPAHVTLDNALLVAGQAALARPDGAALDQPGLERIPLALSGLWPGEGIVLPLAVSNYRNRQFRALATGGGPPQAQDRLAGLSILGGIASGHFGHLVTQALGRLWAADLAPAAPILFLQETGRDTALPGFFKDLAGRLGIRNDLRLVTRVTACDRLLVPQDICNLKHRPPATPWFRAWLAARQDMMDLPPGDGSRVYVSRSRLGPGQGQYLQETALETALAENGYRIFHPQLHSVHEQLCTYAAAGRLIFADGSAGHLWSLVARPEQTAAVILRRPLHHLYARWFRGFHGTAVSFIDCGLADFWSRGGAARSVALLDLDAVWTALRALGFHRDQRAIGPDPAALSGWVAGLAGRRAGSGQPPFPLDELSLQLLGSRRRSAPRTPAAEPAGG